jgi:hypothetical protein
MNSLKASFIRRIESTMSDRLMERIDDISQISSLSLRIPSMVTRKSKALRSRGQWKCMKGSGSWGNT